MLSDWNEITQFKFIDHGKDGHYFIDYLESSKTNPGFTEQYISKHKESIKYLLQNHKNEEAKVKDKYLWLALYHNAHILKHKYSNKFEIEREAIEALIP